jgi:hypothetical protein
MHCFSYLFEKVIYMFRRDILSIIGNLNTVFTAIGICHTSYVDCQLADSQHNYRVGINYRRISLRPVTRPDSV